MPPDGESVVPPNTPPRKDPGPVEGSLAKEFQDLRNRFLGLTSDIKSSVQEVAEGLEAQETFARKLNREEAKNFAQELADMTALAQGKVAAFSKENQALLVLEKQIAGLKGASERALGRGTATPEAKEAIEQQFEATKKDLQGAYAKDQSKAQAEKTAATISTGWGYLQSATEKIMGLTLAPAQRQAEAALRASGVSTSAGITGMGGILNPTEERQATKALAEAAPRAFNNGSAAVSRMINILGYFNSSVDESTAALAKASYEANLNEKDVASSYAVASIEAQKLGISTKVGAGLLTSMTSALTGHGAGLKDAVAIYATLDTHIKGFNLTGASAAQLMQNLASGLGGLSVEKTMGLVAFTHGLNRMPTIKEMGEDPLKLAHDFYAMTAGKLRTPEERLLATKPVGEMLGIGNLNMAQQMAFQKLLESGKLLNRENLEKVILTGPRISQDARAIEGNAILRESRTSLEVMKTHIESFAPGFKAWLGRQTQKPEGQIIGMTTTAGGTTIAGTAAVAGILNTLGYGTAAAFALGTLPASLTAIAGIGAIGSLEYHRRHYVEAGGH